MHRRYAETRHGQIHVRQAGDGPVVLLLHWTPLSGRMFEGIAPHLVRAGYRVLAPDLLGYGRSDARPEQWSVAAWAANVAEVLDDLRVDRVAMALGGHNGASIVTELALAHPGRVGAVGLDGPPVLSDALRAAFASLVKASPPSTAHELFDRTVALLAEYIPGYRPEGEGLALLWPAMIDYLETGFVPSAGALAGYDIAVRLPLLTQPALLLGAEKDSLASTFDEAAAALQPDRQHKFAGHHPLHFAERHADYARVVLDFLGGLPA